LAAGGESNPALDLSDTAPIENAVGEAIRLGYILEKQRQEYLGVLDTQGMIKIGQWRGLAKERKKKYPDGLRVALDKLLGLAIGSKHPPLVSGLRPY
jgi:hypothetical protein